MFQPICSAWQETSTSDNVWIDAVADLCVGIGENGLHWLRGKLDELEEEVVRSMASAAGVQTSDGRVDIDIAQITQCLVGVLTAKAGKLESSSHGADDRVRELRNGAATKGVEWLRNALGNIGAVEVRALAVAGGVDARPNYPHWLGVEELRAALVKILSPPSQAHKYSMFDVLFDSVVDMKGTFVCLCCGRRMLIAWLCFGRNWDRVVQQHWNFV